MQPGTSEILQHWRRKVPSQCPSVPVTHRPSSKPESEHPVTPCIPGFAEKGQPGRDSGPITCFSPPRARHSTIRSSSCKTKARCELCCCKTRMKERSATQRRAERMSGRTGISRIFAVVCSFALAALQTPPTSACLPASLPVRKSALLLHRSFDNLTACIISGAEAPCQRLSVLCSSRTLHPFLQSIPGFGLEMQLNFVIIAEAAGLLQTLGAAELCPIAEAC